MLAAALTMSGVAMTAAPAEACGGFFCSQVPIDQSGEDIVFTYDPLTGDVTATIRILYTGAAEDFAWVVPVSVVPEISIAPQDLFDQLRWRTNPRWSVNWSENNGNCSPYYMFAESDGARPGAGASDPSDDKSAVEVLAQQDVGAYETVTLKSDDPEALYNYLNENGFDQPEESLPLIEHYVQNDMFFVAMKLKSGADVGEIQPVTLKMQSWEACVPLILTRIAATPDMPVRIWMLGKARAVPTNWMHVVINEKKNDWFNFGSNYNDIVTQAINEASGRAFVTEFAGELENTDKMLYWENRFDLDALKEIEDPAKFVQQLLNQGFPRNALMQQLLRTHIPMPQELIDQGVTERDFYNNLDEFYDVLADIDFNPVAFVADLQERVVEPLKDAQQAIDDNPYVTRIYTTVSPDEMTRDPLFEYNSDLPDVSNQHTVNAEAICGGENDEKIQKIIVTFQDEETWELTGPFDPWNIEIGDPDPTEPAAKRIELLGTSGPPTIVQPWMVDAVDRDLDNLEPSAVLDGLASSVGTTDTSGSVMGCSGATQSLPVLGGFALLALFGLAWLRRRREN